MKSCLIAFIFFGVLGLHAENLKSISGQVKLSSQVSPEKVKQGTLYIFAKKANEATAAGTPPLAVLRIPNPKFPLDFSLSEQNAMMPGTPFEGPFVVSARFSPSGDALDKSGPQGSTDLKKKIKLGDKKIIVELK